MMLSIPPGQENQFQICSREFLDFYMVVSGQFKSEADAVMAVSSAIQPISRNLHIGKIFIQMYVPVTSLTPSGQENESVIYLDERGYEEGAAQEYRFETGEGGYFIVKLHPLKNVTWNEG
ncbi:MAG: hypothetical protein IKN55_07835, partial [Oscillospiraceae bacterium]|nr:hypothetical protein [Oscillospiraceae bacterium]